MAGASVLALAGEITSTPAAGAVPALAQFGQGQLGLLRAMRFDKQGRPPLTIASTARRAIVSAPLAYEPFFGAAAEGFEGVRRNGSQADGQLLVEALRRNPRATEARSLLLRHAAANGDLKLAVAQLAGMNRIRADSVQEMMAVLGSAITTEQRVDEAIGVLGDHPELYPAFLLGFAKTEKSAALVSRAVARLPAEAFRNRETRKFAIDLLVAAKDYTGARALWLQRHGKASDLVHSPDFSDSGSPPPFNWKLTEDKTGAAERAPGRGIVADYYGRVPGNLVMQALTLGIGSYTLKLSYRTVSGTPGGIALRLVCAQSGETLADTVLDGRAGRDVRIEQAVAVPAEGCEGQQLILAGRIREMRDSHEIAVQRLDVVRGGGA